MEKYKNSKIIPFKELQLGDWFSVNDIDSEFFVTAIDYEKQSIEVSSPAYLAWTTIEFYEVERLKYTLIGKSKPNIWYKLLLGFRWVCPFKRVDL